MSYFPKPSLNENDLAIIERGDTAAHSIEAGQYVSWHGKTGKAKAAILQGATLDDTLFDYDEDGILNTPINVANYTFNLSANSSDYWGYRMWDVPYPTGISHDDVAGYTIRSCAGIGVPLSIMFKEDDYIRIVTGGSTSSSKGELMLTITKKI